MKKNMNKKPYQEPSTILVPVEIESLMDIIVSSPGEDIGSNDEEGDGNDLSRRSFTIWDD